MTGERWAPVPGYQHYEASDLGRVRSDKMWRGQSATRVLAEHKTRGGYKQVSLCADGTSTHARVHRLVMAAFVGPCPEGQEVRHRDGTRVNNALSNLHYGTRRQNVLDAVRHGTHPMAMKQVCSQGHPFDESNTYRIPSRPNARYCIACQRERSKLYKRRKRSERAA